MTGLLGAIAEAWDEVRVHRVAGGPLAGRRLPRRLRDDHRDRARAAARPGAAGAVGAVRRAAGHRLGQAYDPMTGMPPAAGRVGRRRRRAGRAVRDHRRRAGIDLRVRASTACPAARSRSRPAGVARPTGRCTAIQPIAGPLVPRGRPDELLAGVGGQRGASWRRSAAGTCRRCRHGGDRRRDPGARHDRRRGARGLRRELIAYRVDSSTGPGTPPRVREPIAYGATDPRVVGARPSRPTRSWRRSSHDLPLALPDVQVTPSRQDARASRSRWRAADGRSGGRASWC